MACEDSGLTVALKPGQTIIAVAVECGGTTLRGWKSLKKVDSREANAGKLKC